MVENPASIATAKAPAARAAMEALQETDAKARGAGRGRDAVDAGSGPIAVATASATATFAPTVTLGRSSA